MCGNIQIAPDSWRKYHHVQRGASYSPIVHLSCSFSVPCRSTYPGVASYSERHAPLLRLGSMGLKCARRWESTYLIGTPYIDGARKRIVSRIALLGDVDAYGVFYAIGTLPKYTTMLLSPQMNKSPYRSVTKQGGEKYVISSFPPYRDFLRLRGQSLGGWLSGWMLLGRVWAYGVSIGWEPIMQFDKRCPRNLVGQTKLYAPFFGC